jgi:DNA (cytosine-5)-methyltransferase 1
MEVLHEKNIDNKIDLKIYINIITYNYTMDYTKLSRLDLLEKCKELGIKKYTSKNKSDLIALLLLTKSNTNEHEPVELEGICISHSTPPTPPISDSPTIEKREENEMADIEIQNITSNNLVVADHSNTMNLNDVLKLVDLFAGTGAFSYAFHLTNKVKTIFANDMLDSSEKIYNLNNDIPLTKQNLNDIENTKIPPFHILTAGFPCQPFSIAGMQKGFEDERSNVFWKIISIIQSHSPEIVILENVKNLQSHDNGNTFRIIIEHLEKCQYFIKYEVLNTCKITDIPQNRERIYIVCFKNKSLYDAFHFDFPTIPNRPIVDFLETDIPEKYYYTNKSMIYEELQKTITKPISTNTIYQYRRYYVRENKNSVCPTLTANMGSGGHNVPLILDNRGIRKITPRECFSLQGFPHDYKMPNVSTGQLYSLAGNAVSVPVVKLIANRIVEIVHHLY